MFSLGSTWTFLREVIKLPLKHSTSFCFHNQYSLHSLNFSTLLSISQFFFLSLYKITTEKDKILPCPTLNQCSETGNEFGFLCPNSTGHSTESFILLPTKRAASLSSGHSVVPQPWHCGGKQIYHAIILQCNMPGSDKLAHRNTLPLCWHMPKPAGEQLGFHCPPMAQGNVRLERIWKWPIIMLQWRDRA